MEPGTLAKAATSAGPAKAFTTSRGKVESPPDNVGGPPAMADVRPEPKPPQETSRHATTMAKPTVPDAKPADADPRRTTPSSETQTEGHPRSPANAGERPPAPTTTPQVQEKVLTTVNRAYISNPYTPDVATDQRLSRILAWDDVAKLDGVALKIPRAYSRYLGAYAFNPANGSVLFSVSSAEGYFVYREEKAELLEYGSYHSAGDVAFSGDGKHALFTAAEADKQWSIWLDGKKRFGPFAERPVVAFGPDGRGVLYAVRDSRGCRVFEDSREVFGPCDAVSWIRVSAAARVAMEVERKEKHFLVVDGKEEGPYRSIWGFSFDGPGKRYAYVARRSDDKSDQKESVVIDGKEGPSFRALRVGPVFSPRGSSVGFVAEEEREVRAEPPKRHPDGSVTMTVDLHPRKNKLIINGEPRFTRGYSNLNLMGSPTFGIHELCVNDSGALFVYVDVGGDGGGDGLTVRVSGLPVTWPCQDFVQGGEPRFIAENTVRFVALKRRGEAHPTPVYQVELKLPE